MKKYKILIWISLFAISMGIFEGAVVVYLRALYYPEGFAFPLKLMNNNVAITELIREFASLIMLLSVGVIAGKNFSQKFAWFIYTFAVWDIVYYIFLYLILSWPESIFTWDILFLLPVAWTGPVISPVIISLLMILLAFVILIKNSDSNNQFKIIKREWILLIAGSLIIFVSFIWDYCKFINQNLSNIEISDKTISERLYFISFQYIPDKFPWLLFICGVLTIIIGILIIIKRNNTLFKLD